MNSKLFGSHTMIQFVKVHSIAFLFSTGLSVIQAQDDKNSIADTAVLLDAVTVEAYQINGQLRNIPGSLSVLTSEGIRLSDGTNMATTLNTVPGVNMQNGTFGTNRIVIRGMGSRTPYNTNRIRAYLNDIPLTTSDGVSTPEEIDLRSFGRIEVIKGPASALYGSGLGGNINLYTPSHMQNEGNAGIQQGSFNTAKSFISGNKYNENFDLWGSINYLQSDGYRDNNHYQRAAFISAGEWKHKSWSVSYLLLFIDVKAGIPSSLGKTLFETNPQAAAPNWEAIGGYEKYRKGVAGITLKNRLSDKITNKLAFFLRGNNSFEKRPFNNLDDQSLSFGVRNKLNLHTSKTDWVFGAEWIAEQYRWNLEKDGEFLANNHENRNQIGIFAILYYRPVSKFNISVAGALNYTGYKLSDDFTPNGNLSGHRNFPVIVSPRIGINYAPNDIAAVYASVGHGYSLPSPEETLLPEGNVNPAIKPEQGIQYETGTRLHLFRNTMELDGALYWIELNNLLVTKRLSEEIFMGINAGKSRHQGFELLMRNRMVNQNKFPGKLNSVFSYSGSFNRFIEFTDDTINYNGKRLPGIPDQSMQLQLIWNPIRWVEFTVHLQYFGSQYLNDSNTEKYGGYFTGNMKAKIGFQVKKIWTFECYMGINNFTDTHYASMLIVNARGVGNNEPRYYYPGLPVHGYAGINLVF